MESVNETGVVVAEEPTTLERFQVIRKVRSLNISVEISESIIRLLNGKALSVAQVAFKLRISHGKAGSHLFYLWKNGYILRSKYSKEKTLVYTACSNPIIMICYTCTTLNNGSVKASFITFEERVLLEEGVKI